MRGSTLFYCNSLQTYLIRELAFWSWFSKTLLRVHNSSSIKVNKSYIYIFYVLKSTDPNNMDKREVTQYHFSSWPDHCVPRDTAAFLMFHHKLKATLVIDPGPVVVHCRSVVIPKRDGTTRKFMSVRVFGVPELILGLPIFCFREKKRLSSHSSFSNQYIQTSLWGRVKREKLSRSMLSNNVAMQVGR